MGELVQQIEMKSNYSYNYYLFQCRKERDMGRIKFAHELGISYFKYALIENGYIKPNAKEIKKINNYLGIDFNYYLDGDRSYPTELPEKNPSKIVQFIYRLLGNKIVKGILIGFASLFLVSTVVGLVGIGWSVDAYEQFLGEDVVQLKAKIIENNEYDFSLFNSFQYPQISEKTVDTENNTEKFVQISANNEEYDYALDFDVYFWSDDYRVILNYISVDNEGVTNYRYEVFRYEDSYFGFGYANYKADGTYELLSFETDENITNAVKSFLDTSDLNDDFTDLIKNKTSLDLDFVEDVALKYKYADEQVGKYSIGFALLHVFSVVFSAASIFGVAYAFIYGYRKNEVFSFRHGDELIVGNVAPKEPKTDIKFIPFLPETFMEILGIAFVAIGSFRIVILASQLGAFASDAVKFANGDLLTIQMLGMFLLYFIDFDLFMDDKRVLRNVFMYMMMFLVLYYIEAIIMSSFANSENLISLTLNFFFIPNPFGSVGGYFAIMAFLFFTPKFIKSKKGLIIYRSLSVLPLIYLIVSFLIFHGDVFFGMDLSNAFFRYFFNSERLSFTVLAVGYLFGLFFLRLFFKKKYGEEAGTRYLNGNRFILLKNILICVIVIIVWAVDLFFTGNKTLNSMGIGTNGLIIVLVPFLLFYHPHKGPRNLAVDYTTQFLYFLSLSYAYVLAVAVAIVSLAT